jgi:glutathione synthase/RimK-type ligase-like ATP-grasp enzyme
MATLVVVNDPKDWLLDIPGVQVVAARAYLTDESYSNMRPARVFNLCRSYRYQSAGYYVSLLAAARGHRPLPSVTTVQDLKSLTIIRAIGDDVQEEIQTSLRRVKTSEFALSIYFGQNVAKRYRRLARQVFNLFPSPLLRAHFVKSEDEWRLARVRTIPLSEVPPSHYDFMWKTASEYFAGKHPYKEPRRVMQYDMAILYDTDAPSKPSTERAIAKFEEAAENAGFNVSILTKEDYGSISEFDALFIRDTTFVNHYTYRFSRRAAAEGLVVIDDPESILRCTNKVYLAELMRRHKIGIPRTLVVHRGNCDEVAATLGLPCILKQPDSAFSLGVTKASTLEELETRMDELLDDSDLIVAQEFMRTDFDWRIGVFDRQPLFAARYHMVPNHWQIVGRGRRGERTFGRVEAVAVEDVPKPVLRSAVRAANLIGNGLYGVDVKQQGNRAYIIEVNDNPNIDAGYEDTVLGDRLYQIIMEGFARRVRQRGEPGNIRGRKA